MTKGRVYPSHLDSKADHRHRCTMQFYGLHDRDLAEIVEFYASLEDADRELREIVHDEPDWTGRYGIVLADFSVAEVTITPVAVRS